jgi:hypothetical protein
MPIPTHPASRNIIAPTSDEIDDALSHGATAVYIARATGQPTGPLLAYVDELLLLRTQLAGVRARRKVTT